MDLDNARKVMEALASRRVLLGKSWNDVANDCYKDVSTVKKQMAADSNPRLSTVCQLADVLGVELLVVSEESVAASVSNDVEAYRATIAEQQEKIDELLELLDTERARVERRNATIAEMTESAKRKERMIETMYESIEEKDKIIAKLLRDTGRV